MKNFPKNIQRIGLQVALLAVAFALISVTKIEVIGLIWLGTSIGLGLYWEWSDRPLPPISEQPRRGKTSGRDLLHTFLVLFFSILVPMVAAISDLNSAVATGIGLSFIGLPQFLPIGAIALGRICPLGYSVSLDILNSARIPKRKYLLVLLSLAGFAMSYVAFFVTSDYRSVDEFLQAFSANGPYWLLAGASYRGGGIVGGRALAHTNSRTTADRIRRWRTDSSYAKYLEKLIDKKNCRRQRLKCE